ncbi:MAG: S41 family peptidase [Bacteroidaceae bacterium]|nr:S41 family peptidase [Bacteroidaceae bacterium]
MKKIIFTLFWAIMFNVQGSMLNAQNLANTSQQLKIFNQLYKTLDLYYVDSLDAERNISTAIRAMLDQLDPYTEYYTASDTKDLNTLTTGKYAGIGSLIHYYKAADRCVIYRIYEDKPAQHAGLKEGDIILSIDGREMGPKGSQETPTFVSNVSSALRGDPNTTANITVKRGTDTLSFAVTRANIHMPPVTYSGMVSPTVGYIYLSTFTAECSQDVEKALRSLKAQGATSLILDLRDNGGGLAHEAVEIVNLFVPKGKLILKMKGKTPESNTSHATQRQPTDPDIPLVVLVNGNSASSSEIVCGSLQDLDRAVIVGERTFGKGLVQQPHNLPYDAVLKVTSSHYYIPSGRCIQALDYSHRSSDGQAYRTPDSLTSVFYTEAGRPVRDGGGITPDVAVGDTLPTALLYVLNSDNLFDWITDYCKAHPSIEPADRFAVSEDDFEDFIAYLTRTDYQVESRSKQIVTQLRSILKAEGSSPEALSALDTVESNLQPDLPALMRSHKARMMSLLSAAICERYYYDAGATQNKLLHDKQLDAAVSVLQDQARYRELLSKK